MAAPVDLIPRDAITAALDNAVQAGPITLVIAPSGLGKSTAVGEWFRRRDDAAWVTSGPFTDPRVLVTAGLGNSAGASGLAAADATPSLDAIATGTGFAGWLAAHLRCRPQLPAILVIDDAHVIDPRQLTGMLDAASALLADGSLRLVLVGQLPLRKMLAYVPDTAVIDARQLTFTSTELRGRFGEKAEAQGPGIVGFGQVSTSASA